MSQIFSHGWLHKHRKDCIHQYKCDRDNQYKWENIPYKFAEHPCKELPQYYLNTSKIIKDNIVIKYKYQE